MAAIKSKSINVLKSGIAAHKPAMTGILNSRGMTATAHQSSNPTTSRATDTTTPFFSSPSTSTFTPVQSKGIPITDAMTQRSSNPFDALVNSLTSTLTTTPPTSPTLLRNLSSLMRNYTSNLDHWSKYAHANPQKAYTRNLVFEVPGVFNLLILVWTPGCGSPIHDHADAHCLMKVLKGTLREQRFAMPKGNSSGPLQEFADLRFGEGKVAYIADTIGLHAVSNPHPTDYAVSLHLYTPPNAAVHGASVYDAKSGQGKLVGPCTYDTIRGIRPSSIV